MEKETKKITKKEEKPAIKLASGNKEYIKQNLEFMEFIQKNKCKTKEIKNGRK